MGSGGGERPVDVYWAMSALTRAFNRNASYALLRDEVFAALSVGDLDGAIGVFNTRCPVVLRWADR